jgi:hypothetical protein
MAIQYDLTLQDLTCKNMGNLLYLFILLVLGKFSRQLSVFPENTPQILNLFVIY